MSLALLILVQVQESPRLSKAAMVAAVLVFIMGVSLLVYFFRRYRRTERELQDEWDRPEQSLFAPSEPSLDRGEEHLLAETERAVSTDAAENEEPEPERRAEAEPAPIPAPAEPQHRAVAEPLTQELQSEVPIVLAPASDIQITQRKTEVLSSETEAEGIESDVAAAVIASRPDTLSTEHPTEVPSSEKPPGSTESDAITESILFDNDIWVGLEMPEPEAPAATQRFGVEQKPTDGPVEQRVHASVPRDAAEPATPLKTELLGAARVDSYSPRERFESPGTSQIAHRDSLEPPHVEMAQHRVQPSITEPAPPESRTRILGSSPAGSEQHTDGEALANADASSAEIEASIAAPAAANNAASMRVRAGSVLGLPAERSHAPLVLGAPVKPRDEIGIGALSNYGRDIEGGGGHGGTITLAAVILLLGGGFGTYLFVPSVHSWVNTIIQRVRGIDPNPPAPVEPDKARVFAARNEANKNRVKARGAVDNISEEILNNLALEVSLERGNGAAPELRKVPIKPAQLAPKERGVFEFEYDGNRATGFGGYRIVRLLSGESEIKFATPGRAG